MGIINSNLSACGLVEKYVGTAYDNVKLVADNMEDVDAILALWATGDPDEILALGDEITLAAAMSNYKGIWDSAVTYVLGDSVSHNDQIYMANGDSLNSEPDNNLNADWLLLQANSTGTLADIHALGAGVDGQQARVTGVTEAGDGGRGDWYWRDATDKATANLGYVMDPSVDFTLALQGTGIGTGCWVRDFNEGVNPRWFMAVGDGNTDDTEALQKMLFAVSKDDNFKHTTWFPRVDKERGIGEVPSISFNGEDVHLISSTLVFSTNVALYGNGVSLIADAANPLNAYGTYGAMLELRYNYQDDGVESYGTMFNVIRDFKIYGGQVAPIGILLDRTNWTEYSNLYISGCTHIGLKLEECQYSTFSNVFSNGNGDKEIFTGTGIHLGNTSENAGLRCVDLTFVGCGFNSNGKYGVHVSNMGQSNFNKLDVSRNGWTDIMFDTDNGDGSVSSSVNRGNTFSGLKFEHTADDEPASGYAINIIKGYNNAFYRCGFSQQDGTVEDRRAYYKWVRNEERNNLFVDPFLSSQLPNLQANPDNPTSVKAIEGITNAVEAVVTITAHGYTEDQQVELHSMVGMTQIAGFYQITIIDADSFNLQGVDSTAFGVFSSGQSNLLEDVSLFQCASGYGLRVHFGGWAPYKEELPKIAVEDDGTTHIGAQSGLFNLMVNADYTYHSNYEVIEYTGAELDDATSLANTQGKITGRQVWNTTLDAPVWATSPYYLAKWVDGNGVAANTPS